MATSSTSQIIKKLSSELEITEERLTDDMMTTYIKTALLDLMKFETNLKKQYGCDSSFELKKKIKKGDVKEHPAWEDYLTWRDVEDSIKRFRAVQKRMDDAG